MKIYDLSELADRPSPMWTVEGLLPDTGLALIYGQPACGKSFFALALAMSIQSGWPFFGIPTRKKPVLYMALEGAQGFTLRALAYQQENNVPVHDLGFFIDEFSLGNTGHVEELLMHIPPKTIIVVDTLAQASGGLDENSARDMSAIVSNIQLLIRERECLVILLHHVSKASPTAARGSSALLGATDAAILIERKKDGTRQWRTTKLKDGPDNQQGAFMLKPVLIDGRFDVHTGEQIGSAIADRVEINHTLTDAHAEAKLNNEAEGVLLSLQEYLLENEKNKANLDTWRSFYVECRKKQGRNKEASLRTAFSRAKKLLIDRKIVVSDGEYFQLNQADVRKNEA